MWSCSIQSLSDRGIHPFPWKSIWKVKCPTKVAFFTWTMVRGRILTLDNLRKRNICIFNRCWMRKNDWKPVDYLLIHCPSAFDLWCFILSLFGTSKVMPKPSGWVGLEVEGDIGRHLFGILFRSFLCGTYGEKGTTESLRGRSILSSSWSTFSFCLCFNGGLLWVVLTYPLF